MADASWRRLSGIPITLPVLLLRVTIAAAQDFGELDLEQLMQVEVTSVAKKPQKRSSTAAALYVLGGDEIRRLGATTIPDALRMVPGVQVARVDSNKWAVGIRGFASRLSRSMLVLIDGRSVYDPLFAGTYWETQDTLLEDVEQIEVIRGPGGTIWGANAVNGVINIITKSAKATQGGYVEAGGGDEQRGFAGARYGGKLGNDLYYRVYGKFFDRDGGFNPDGPDYDDWWMGRGGFRIDWDATPQDLLKLQGDVYDGDTGQQVTITELDPPSQRISRRDSDLTGGNVLGRWERTLSKTADVSLQSYYDYTSRSEPNFRERRDTFDVEAQHRFVPFSRHELTWGVGYRLTADETGGVETVEFTPRDRTDHLVTGFAQDEVQFLDGRLRLIGGTKLEHNDYSGFELQPSGRVLWEATDRNTLWAAVSRAVRTPTRIEHDVRLDALEPMSGALFRLLGDEDFDPEEVVSYEVGWRVRPIDKLFVDVAGFYSRYDDLLSLELGRPFQEAGPGGQQTFLPVFFRNGIQGETYGIEVAVGAAVTEWCDVHVSYAALDIDLSHQAGSSDLGGTNAEGTSPHNQLSLWTTVELPAEFDGTAAVRYVDNLPIPGIDSYLTFDLRLARQFGKHVELSAVGRNLSDNHQREFAGGTEVEREVYGRVRVRW